MEVSVGYCSLDRIQNIEVDAYSDVDGNKLAQGVSLAKAHFGYTLCLVKNEMIHWSAPR